MIGGLNFELVTFRSFGTSLQESGWTVAITHAEIASSGTTVIFCLHLECNEDMKSSLY